MAFRDFKFTRPRLRALPALILASLAAPLPAAPSDQIRIRIEGYRELGAALKAINDGLRTPSPQLVAIRTAVRRIRDAANQQYNWFPAGSGPRPGHRTGAKSEIWTQAPRFRQLQNGFTARANALEQAVAGGNVNMIRNAARTLGASCKACHDQFRSDAK